MGVRRYGEPNSLGHPRGIGRARGPPPANPVPAQRCRHRQQDQPVDQRITGKQLRDSRQQEDPDHRIA